MTIDDIISEILKAEGGYVNDPNDSGGETMYGITVAVARANGYTGSMKDLPLHKARDIYYQKYVVTPGFHKIHELNAAIAAEVVDTGVNMGPVVAGKFLQRSLNALCGAGLVVDGAVGPRTLNALYSFMDTRGRDPGTKVLLKTLNSLQCVRYIELVENATKNRTFIYGWVANRVNI